MLSRQALPRLGAGCVLGSRVASFHSSTNLFTKGEFDGAGRGRGRGVGSVDKFFMGRGQAVPQERKETPRQAAATGDQSAAGSFASPKVDLGRGTQSSAEPQQQRPPRQPRPEKSFEDSGSQPSFGRGTRRGKEEVLGSFAPRRTEGERGSYRGRGGARGGALAGTTEGPRPSRGSFGSDRGGRGGFVDRGGRGGFSRGGGLGGRGGYIPRNQGDASAAPRPSSEYTPRPRAEVSPDGVGGAEEFNLGGAQESIDDEDFSTARRTRDFDIEGFLDHEPCYDRTDVTNKVRIIYLGETARELEAQEEHAWVHKHKDPGWMLSKHQKLLERIRQRKEIEQLTEELAFDDWAFVEDVDLFRVEDPNARVIRTPEGDVLPPRTSNDVETKYLAGYEQFQQQRPTQPTTAIEDILRMPGLALQRTPTPKADMDDIMSAYIRRKARQQVESEEAKFDRMSLSEGIISEDMIQRVLPRASAQGITEESVRIFASTLSMNRHLPFAEKLARFRILCGWNAQDRAIWEPKISAILS